MLRRTSVALALCLLAAATSEAQARQRRRPPAPPPVEDRVRVGGHLAYADDADLGVGLRVVVPLPGLGPIDLVTSADWFFPRSTEGPPSVERDHWEVNANLAYRFGRRLQPYAGGGLNVARRKATLTFLGQRAETAETRAGLNLLAGARWPLGRRWRLFAEARVEIEGGEQKLIAAGILF